MAHNGNHQPHSCYWSREQRDLAAECAKLNTELIEMEAEVRVWKAMALQGQPMSMYQQQPQGMQHHDQPDQAFQQHHAIVGPPTSSTNGSITDVYNSYAPIEILRRRRDLYMANAVAATEANDKTEAAAALKFVKIFQEIIDLAANGGPQVTMDDLKESPPSPPPYRPPPGAVRQHLLYQQMQYQHPPPDVFPPTNGLLGQGPDVPIHQQPHMMAGPSDMAGKPSQQTVDGNKLDMDYSTALPKLPDPPVSVAPTANAWNRRSAIKSTEVTEAFKLQANERASRKQFGNVSEEEQKCNQVAAACDKKKVEKARARLIRELQTQANTEVSIPKNLTRTRKSTSSLTPVVDEPPAAKTPRLSRMLDQKTENVLATENNHSALISPPAPKRKARSRPKSVRTRHRKWRMEHKAAPTAFSSVASETGVGKVINKLRNHEEYGPRAMSIVEKWNAIAKSEEVSNGPEKPSSSSSMPEAWNIQGEPDAVFAKAFGMSIRRKDLLSLRPSEWLNDEVVNFYMSLICERNRRNPSLPSAYAFNTFFYPTLVKKGYANVKKWTKKVDIFTYDLLFIPIHLINHWCLVVVDLRQKCAMFYDSYMNDDGGCLKTIMDYLTAEMKQKMGQDLDVNQWNVFCRKNIPQQFNGSDCGIFCLKFAEYTARRARIDFDHSRMSYFRERMVYEICNQKLDDEQLQEALEAMVEWGVPHSAFLQVFNVPEFTRILVYVFKPRMAKRLMPCLPSYLMLMAFRYYDQTLDDAGLTGLFNSFQTTLKEVTSTATDTDTLVLWLINGWRLFNLLRQYSNEEQWKGKNTSVQMGQCIKNFNLEPLRNQLKLRVDLFYNNLMKRTVEPLLIPKIVPAILQHESGAFMTNDDSKESQKRSLPDLIEFLNFVFAKLKNYGADEILTGQVFRQISQWICSLALNHMMFRRELCTPVKAISIKHNVMEIQAWLSKNKIRGSEMFEPLIQASHLLQIRKSEAYLDILCGETTSKLNSKQVMTILRHFSPSDGFEDDTLTEEFLAKVNQKLASRSSSDATEKDELLMRGTYLDPFDSDSFLYTDVQLETISLPTCLDFQSVSRLI